jgi:hypothetical protein
MLPVGVAGGSFEADRVATLKPESSCFRYHDALAVRHVDAGPDVESNGCLEHLRIPLALEGLEATNSCSIGVTDNPGFAPAAVAVLPTSSADRHLNTPGVSSK